MAGSLETFVYESDSSERYLIRLDEGNARAVAMPEAVAADLSLPEVPKRLKPRHVYAKSATGVTRKLVVGSITSDYWDGTNRIVNLPIYTANTGDPYPFTITTRTGEKERFLSISDTGQTDTPGEGQSPATGGP